MADEVYLKIIPLTKLDHKRVGKCKGNPLQRLKILKTTFLSTIAQYAKCLVTSPDDDSLTVQLLISVDDFEVTIPQTLTILEFFIITHQEGEGEIRYTYFINRPKQEEIPFSSNQLQGITEPQPPQIAQIPTEIPKLNSDYSNFTGFHSGFSLFSNTFSQFPSNSDSNQLSNTFAFGNYLNLPALPERAQSEESISLRKELESVINNKKSRGPSPT